MPVCFDLSYSHRAVATRAVAKQLVKKGIHPKFAQVIARKTLKSTSPRRR